MYDFSQITLFCLEKRLSKHKMTIFQKYWGEWPLWPPLLRLWLSPPCSKQIFRKQMHCVEESTCDIVVTFRLPLPLFRAPAVFQHPHSDSAPVELCPLVTPLLPSKVQSLPAKLKQMVSVQPLNTHRAGIDTNTSTTFTLLLVIRTQRYMWSLDKGGCSSNST